MPALFIAGRSDWGVNQVSGALESMPTEACTIMLGCHLIDGAGHWVMQVRPEAVSALLVPFCRQVVGA